MMQLTIRQAKALMDKNGGNLYLSYTPITALPDNLTVGGWLDLSGTQVTSLPDYLTVGDSLDLRNTQVTSLPDNLTVGGWLDLSGTPITNKSKVKRLHDGDYVKGRYLYADGILTHVKGVKTVHSYTIYIGKIKGKNVVSDGVHYAHCNNMRAGIADLAFKSAADRGADQYKSVTLDTVMTAEDIIAMYRVITGACHQGTDMFVSSLKLKSQYTVREAIEITKGQYRAKEFAAFFVNKEAK